MDIFSLTSYMFRGTVSLVCAIMLFCIRLGGTRNAPMYNIVHKSLAALAIIDAIVDGFTVHMILHHMPYLTYDWFWIPKCYVEMTVMGVAILKPIRSPHRAWWFPPLLWYRIITDTPAYLRTVQNHLAGQVEHSCYLLGRVAAPLYTLYIISSTAEMFNYTPWLDNIYMTISTAIVLASTLAIINFQPYAHNAQALPDTIIERATIYTNLNNEKGVTEAVTQWQNSSKRPWLVENININDVASQMGISPRLLSTYLNSVHQMNFATWINSLKVETLLSTLARNPRIDSTQLLVTCGFNSPVNMSRVVKHITGKTVTELRREARQKG